MADKNKKICKKCEFVSCRANNRDTPDRHFFHFPKNRPEICRQWVINCANKKLDNVPDSKLQYRVVCDRHFKREYFTSDMKTRLEKNAVPTELEVHNQRFPKDKDGRMKSLKKPNGLPTPSTVLCPEHLRPIDIDQTSYSCAVSKKSAVPSTLPEISTESITEESLDSVELEDNHQEEPQVNMSLSQDENLENKQEYLVCLVEAYPILYNPFDPDFGDEVKVAETWLIISDVVDLPVEDCQIEWNALLSKYKKQRQVILEHEKKGHKAKSTWPLYDTFNFIEKLLQSHEDSPTTNDDEHYKWIQHELSNINPNRKSTLPTRVEDNTTSYNNGLEMITEPTLGTRNSDENFKLTKSFSLRQYENTSQSMLEKFSEDTHRTKPVITDINEDVQFVNSLLPVLIRMKQKKKSLCKAELMATMAKYKSSDEA